MSLRRWRAATLPSSHSDGRSPWANIRLRPQCAAWRHSHTLRARTVHARCAGSGRATRPGDAVESAVSRGGVFVQGASGLLLPLCVHRTHWIVKDAVRIHQLAPPTSFRCYELSVRAKSLGQPARLSQSWSTTLLSPVRLPCRIVRAATGPGPDAFRWN